jgi:Ca2+-binding RTX toxin-like protein
MASPTTWTGSGINDSYSLHQNQFTLTYDGLAGTDTLSIDSNTSKSMYNITQHGMEIWVDSKSAASGYHVVLKNVEKVNFQSGGIVDLTAQFPSAFLAAADTTRPTIAISSNDYALTVGQTATITFTLSEASTDFVVGDITFSGGTLSNFTGSGTSYTALFTPTTNSTANGVISVASTKFTDAAANANVDGADANNTVTMTVNTIVAVADTTPPTISISTNDYALTVGQTATITFTLSEASTDFVVGDIAVSGGSLSNFIGSGTTYTATFTPTASSTANGVVDVANTKFTDAAGNPNIDGADANNTVTMAVNTMVAINGTAGNDILPSTSGNDLMYGFAGNDTLNGGLGADTMHGGTGKDTYVVDNASDSVTEELTPAAEVDTVLSSINYILGSNLENLTLTGTANINGTGNVLKNTITGNAGSNILDGGVDIVADKLIGGAGNDIYIVDLTIAAKLQDSITESSKTDIDTLQVRGTSTNSTAVTLTLAKTLENLDSSDTGLSLINLTGNTSNNTITGNDAANVLKGVAGNDTITGGAGNDTLVGGAGNDTLTGGADTDYFLFDTAMNISSNLDTITDFLSGIDKLQFSKKIFKGLGTKVGNLTADQFWSGGDVTTAHNATDRIIYNSTTGALYYDADGSGTASSAVQVALIGVDTHPSLLATDLFVA